MALHFTYTVGIGITLNRETTEIIHSVEIQAWIEKNNQLQICPSAEMEHTPLRCLCIDLTTELRGILLQLSD